MVSETTTAQYQFDMAVASAVAKTESVKVSSSPTEQPRALDIQPYSFATPIPRISPQPEGLAPDVKVAILEWDMGKGINPFTFTIRQPTLKFGPQDSIYILLHTIASGSVSPSYRSEWYDSRGMLWLAEEGSISLGESFWYLFSNPPSLTDWTPDEYLVKLFVNGEQISTFTFTVEE
jgi:hypothetical protein